MADGVARSLSFTDAKEGAITRVGDAKPVGVLTSFGVDGDALGRQARIGQTPGRRTAVAAINPQLVDAERRINPVPRSSGKEG